ncbi:MAG: hypothetical protein GTO14_18795 [Anaerolineales bacterium]|nr:hypothetical protein [Anaerolineales bacterium]
MKKRLTWFLGSTSVLMLVLTACASSTPQANEPPAAVAEIVAEPSVTEEPQQDEIASTEVEELPATSMTPTLVVADSAFGSILVDVEGMSLYLFTPDVDGVSTCYEVCAQRWPPLLVEDTPVAGDDLDESMLGSTMRDDGTLQVTYGGWPLYFFAGDSAPGDTSGQEVGDVWYLVTPGGEAITSTSDEDIPNY